MSEEPRETPTSAAGSIGERVLAEIREVGGDELVREVLAIFVERTPGRLQAAGEAIERGDLATAARALHSLRSAAATIGAHRLAELAGRLERLAAGGAGDDLAAGFGGLRRAAEEALAAARGLTGS